MTISDIIKLSEILAEMGHIKRITKLPSGEFESDSHHSFSLALIAYQFVVANCPELDADKVMLYALCHDLLEIITGDEETLHYTPDQHAAKHRKERESHEQFDEMFEHYPALRQAVYEYEKLDTSEAATVFVLDKACVLWTYHAKGVSYPRGKSLASRQDVDRWTESNRDKFKSRLSVDPPAKVYDIFNESHQSLRDLFSE